MKQTTFLGLRPCTSKWIVLIMLTLASVALGVFVQRGLGLALSVLGIAVFKGQLVADHFMGLKRAHPLWRGLVFSYLAVIGVAIAVAYSMGQA
jgi:cytochrome c oxidase subunit 4